MSSDENKQGKNNNAARLRREKADLELALQIAIEHGDTIENQLLDTNDRLKAEIRRRLQLESYLKILLNRRDKEKQDLQIILDTIIQHGDAMDDHWFDRISLLQMVAETDGLTRIANRRRFDQYLEQQWEIMADQKQYISLILCDIDFFKQFNDAYGHVSGDGCLKRIAFALSSAMRSEEDLVARYGGEEFAVVLPATELQAALQVADRIQAVVSQLSIPHRSSTIAECVTLSIGIASTIPSPQSTSTGLIESADRMLYAAKNSGRNKYLGQQG